MEANLEADREVAMMTYTRIDLRVCSSAEQRATPAAASSRGVNEDQRQMKNRYFLRLGDDPVE